MKYNLSKYNFDADTDCPGEQPGCLDKAMIAIGPDKRNRRRDAIYVAYEAEGGQKVVKSADDPAAASADDPDATAGADEAETPGRPRNSIHRTVR